MFKKSKAFTLIELLVVIAIIGILVTVAVVALNNARAKARDAKRVANIKQVQTALELFYNDMSRYPTTAEFNSGSLLSTSTGATTTYMARIPNAPTPADGTCETTNDYIYTSINDGASYTISYCLGGKVASLAAGNQCATPDGISDGTCLPCTPNCSGKVCGDDGCGGSCGTCTGNDVCNNGACETIGDSFSCPGIPVVQYDNGPYDATGLIRNQGGYYRTVQIGTQCWLRDNLNAGTMISGINSQTDNSILEKYCYNDHEINPDPAMTVCNNGDNCGGCDTDGGLYQWNEAMQYSTTEGVQGICPIGWHIPSDAEQNTLDQYLTDSPNTCDANRVGDFDCANAGTKLMIGGTSGFDGMPTGYRSTDLSFYSHDGPAYIWSSTATGSDVWGRLLYASFADVDRNYYVQGFGFLVRCLKN